MDSNEAHFLACKEIKEEESSENVSNLLCLDKYFKIVDSLQEEFRCSFEDFMALEQAPAIFQDPSKYDQEIAPM